ncbi:MAG: hypothetical protein R3E21_00765 [Caenibius sp.]
MTIRTIVSWLSSTAFMSSLAAMPAHAALPAPDHAPVVADNVDTAAARARLDPAQRQLLRCSAAFALVSHLKSRGDVADLPTMPATDDRLQEYFVRAGAELMDKAGLSRAELSALLAQEVRALSDREALNAAMPTCAASLEASGL